MLKGTQRRLLDTANTLGLSRNVIGWIERRRYAVNIFHPIRISLRALQYAGYLHLLRRGHIHFFLLLHDMEILGMKDALPPIFISQILGRIFPM